MAIFWLLWVVVQSTLISTASASSADRARLKSTLLHGYRADTRPVQADDTQTNVTVVIGLRQILNMDMRNEIVTARMDFLMRWTDEFLRWNTSDYDGIEYIHLYAYTIWTPDIILYNEIKEGGNLKDMLQNRVRVSHTGHVHWPSAITSLTSCPLDMQDFPWDEQLCSWKLGSWIYPLHEINLLQQPDDENYTVSYVEHGEWELVEKLSSIHRSSEGIGDGVVWPIVTFSVRIKRRPLFFVVNMIMPSIIITVLSLLAFCVPPEEGEKITVSFTVLLASAVFLLVVNDIMPVQSYTVPMISEFYVAVLACLALSTIATVFVTCIHHKGTSTTEMSPSGRKFTCLLSRCFYMTVQSEACGRVNDADLQDTTGKSFRAAEWSLLANCLDRLFLIIFSFLFLICFIVTLT